MNYPLNDRQRALLHEMGIAIGPMGGASNLAAASVATTVPTTPSTSSNARVAPAQAERKTDLAKPQSPQSPTPTRLQTPVTTGPGELSESLPENLSWTGLAERASGCNDCALGQTRQRSVWGVFLNGKAPSSANVGIDILIVTDPPDEVAEHAGLPLGEPSEGAHKMVENMVAAMGRAAQGALPLAPCVFVTNLTKCRLPVGETLGAAHLQACRRYIDQTIAHLRPRLVVAMGRSAGLALMDDPPSNGTPAPLGRLRGQVRMYQSTPWVATFTPQYLLRNTKEKAKAWEDLCLGLSVLTEADPA
jgi:uracil-DNA glycosylase family 4